MKSYDVLIIGCGVTGAAAAYELSRFELSVGVVERSNDVGCGATKANSAILHAGYDPEPGTLCARLNVEGVRLAKEICEKLSVLRRELPSFVLAFNETEMELVRELKRRGDANGVEGTEVLSREQVLAIEPSVNPEILGALYAPHSAIVDPWEYTCAMAETAVVNGAEVNLSCEVTSIEKTDDIFTVHTTGGDFSAKYIVNAAGCYAAKIAAMVGDNSITPVNLCGQYYVLDKCEGRKVNSVVFRCPDKNGKGVLVSPTVHGNLIVGPDAYTVEDGDTVGTVANTLPKLKPSGLRSVPGIDYRQVIHEYAGVRPATTDSDFVINVSPACENFINLAGIKSPGLSAAPAVALEGVKLLRECGLETKEKANFKDERKVVRFNRLSDGEKAEIIKENPLYGQIICRCETVTEGDIVAAIHRPIVPRSIDAIKRRTGAGLGRCQGGFCSPRVHEILARELGVSPLDIPLGKDGSYILTGKTKEADR